MTQCNISESEVFDGSESGASIIANENAFSAGYKYFSYMGWIFETMNPNKYNAEESMTQYSIWNLKYDT